MPVLRNIRANAMAKYIVRTTQTTNGPSVCVSKEGPYWLSALRGERVWQESNAAVLAGKRQLNYKEPCSVENNQ